MSTAPPLARMPEPGRAACALAISAAALLAAIVVAHAALLPSGRWQADEYMIFAFYRRYGLALLRHRLLHWSPRPFSELAIYLFSRAVAASHASLVAPTLGVAWAMLAGGTVLGLCRRGPGLAWTALVAAAILAAFLLVGGVGEMFYWPDAALAYLPALAGVTAAVLLLLRGLADEAATGRRAGFALALLLAASSAETGAMAAAAIAGAVGLVECPRLLRHPRALRLVIGRVVWWALPLAGGAAVLIALAATRAQMTTELVVANGPGRHLLTSFAAAFASFVRLLVAPGLAPDAPWSQVPGALAWWLPVFAAGLAIAFRAAGWQASPAAPLRHHLAAVAGLLGAAYLSLATALFQFGVPCCSRLYTFRACLIVLALCVLAALAARTLPAAVWRALRPPLAPLLLCAALAIPFATRLPALLDDYAQQGAVLQARRQNWAQFGPGSKTLRFAQPPRPHVVNDATLPITGPIEAGPNTPWYAAGVLDFFGKSRGEIMPPS